MRHLLALCLLASLLAACSSPKYTYYFSHAGDPASSTAKAESGILQVDGSALVAANEPTTAAATAPVLPESFALPVEKKIEENTSSNELTKAERKAVKRELRSVIRNIKKQRNENFLAALSPEQTATNPRNNGFAIAGFVLALLGWFVLWPLVILGIIFSAIGLKSERRGLATAGLVIGLVGIVLLLIAQQNSLA